MESITSVNENDQFVSAPTAIKIEMLKLALDEGENIQGNNVKV